MPPLNDYKLTDLDYLIGDHHLQMIKAALPYLGIPEQRAVSLFVKAQELRKTIELFETEEVASMGICSLEKKEQNRILDKRRGNRYTFKKAVMGRSRFSGSDRK